MLSETGGIFDLMRVSVPDQSLLEAKVLCNLSSFLERSADQTMLFEVGLTETKQAWRIASLLGITSPRKGQCLNPSEGTTRGTGHYN